MKNKLKKYFPMIRTKGEVLEEVKIIKNYGKHFVAGKKNISKNTWIFVQA